MKISILCRSNVLKWAIYYQRLPLGKALSSSQYTFRIQNTQLLRLSNSINIIYITTITYHIIVCLKT
jgi:hypothetical protein